MARQPPKEALAELQQIVAETPAGLSISEIEARLKNPVHRRTLQDRLSALVTAGRLARSGSGRWTKYHSNSIQQLLERAKAEESVRAQAQSLRLSRSANKILAQVTKPIQERRPVSYRRDFLDDYVPNETFYLSQADRKRLADLGRTDLPNEPAGTYAKQIFQRLLIDLSFHSSRLEGNTYSLLDTERLLELGDAAEGKAEKDAQMILNHKDAIDFLVEDAAEIAFNRQTVLNLHGLLSNNLLPDPNTMGRLRWRAVQIGGSSYVPIGNPQLLEETFDDLLQKASAINDPFEQALFALVHLAYLQPFEDVNKRVSRLAANIPLIKSNLRPLSFIDVPKDLYVCGLLGVYEQNRVELFREVFIWAYGRSAEHFAALRQSLGDPDPFRLAHRIAIRDIIGQVVRAAHGRLAADVAVDGYATQNVPAEERERFGQVVMQELDGLHEGNFARYRVRPSEFRRWHEGWGTDE